MTSASKDIVINVIRGNNYGTLRIERRHYNLPEPSESGSSNEMHIMNYRARTIGGYSHVKSGKNRGVGVTRQFPLKRGGYDQ
jgi:hypothetical protein